MSRVTERAAELRRDFDRSFSNPPAWDNAVRQDLLAIRLSTQGFAIRLSEIVGLFADKKITGVAGASAAQIGITGFRGSIVPVFDLQTMLGSSSRTLTGSGTPRWLVVAAAAPIALAFEEFEGQLRVTPDEIKPQHSDAKAHRYTQHIVQIQNTLRSIIHVPSVLETLKI